MPSFSLKARLKSFKYALNGLWLVLKEEHNFWIHLLATAVVVTSGFYFQVLRSEWLWLVFAIGLVLTAEVFNSAIERLVDLKQPERDPKAGKIKDLAAAAVLIAAITAAIIGGLIFWPYLKNL